VPTHVSFGAGSHRCGTVLHPDTDGEITGRYCGRAGAEHLRATFGVVAVLALLALTPLVAHAISPRRHVVLSMAWGVVEIVVTVLGFAWLGWAEYSPP
jgi:Na+/melibiose symporter-like transporter